ncbi:MAG: hypothetical protein OEV33_00305 [Armatimonadota bacterium]|nr:hypothetical protein [Armatimonadota bacterium]
MTDARKHRIEVLTTGPVLRTWHGCVERVRHLSLADRWLLCYHYGCDPEYLHEVLWRLHCIERALRAALRNGLTTAR